MTPSQRLAEIRERAERARWEQQDSMCEYPWREVERHAPEDVPYLLAEVARLREALRLARLPVGARMISQQDVDAWNDAIDAALEETP